MADKLPFPSTPQTSPSGPNIGPMQQPDAHHDGAPAGEWFGSDLPVEHGEMPMRLGSFVPGAANPPLPRDPMDGFTKAPTGGRR